MLTRALKRLACRINAYAKSVHAPVSFTLHYGSGDGELEVWCLSCKTEWPCPAYVQLEKASELC